MRQAGDLWLPENETPMHWALKWCAWQIVQRDFECRTAAGVEVSVCLNRTIDSPYARQDAVGLRSEYRYKPSHQTMLVRAASLIGWSFEQQKDVPWLDTGKVIQRRLKGEAELVDEIIYQTYGVKLDDGRSVEVINPKRNANGEIRVRLPGKDRVEARCIYGADAKQSRSDYQAWLRNWEERVADLDYAVVVTPPGLLEPDEVPEKVGLVEVAPDSLIIKVEDWSGRPNPSAFVSPNVVRAPRRLIKPREIEDATWFKLQADCWQSIATTMHRNMGQVFWPVVQDALTGAEGTVYP